MRSISDEFQNALRDGILKWVTDSVKDPRNKLIICFRDGYVNVYYKSHSLFKISWTRQRYKLSFNLRHARYTESMEEAKTHLENILPEIRVSQSGEAWFYADQLPAGAQTQIIDVYKSYIDDYFDPAKVTDYIRPSRKRDLLEKVRQQEIFTAHFNFSGIGEELVFYDMELSIPRASLHDKDKGAPDCLAVKLRDGMVTEIVLVEVKSTAAACMGEHGIEKHREDFIKILQNPDDREFLYTSMDNSLKNYQALGMLPAVKKICDRKSCRYSVLFFFTDEAIRWTENTRQQNDNYKQLLLLHPRSNLLLNTGKEDLAVRVYSL